MMNEFVSKNKNANSSIVNYNKNLVLQNAYKMH